MTHDLSSRIEYSEKYVDDTHEYRPTTGRVNPEMEKQAKEKYAKEFN
ncbi:hypothetical protein AM588_10008231 [Phytophthora nicotianae]|uniref:Uncharacterized protein n=1 Tax=Phytophthora nicotianae TaxID=4792 RepID=A0A0W8D4N2_PHYNI|nr:hypothetical protein AM588_10008231 [Phytophthora nicotianae]